MLCRVLSNPRDTPSSVKVGTWLLVPLLGQTDIGQILRWIMTLVQTFEVIAFFGAAALLVWVELEIHGLSLASQARRNLQPISGYFLVSFAFFATAAMTDYGMTQPWTLTFQSPLLVFVEALSFIFGLFTLITGAWGLRQSGRSGRIPVSLPEYSQTIVIGVFVMMNSLFLLATGSQYSSLPLVSKVFVVLLLVSYPASLLTVTAWYGKRRWANLGILATISAWLYLLIVLVLVALGIPLY